MKKNKGEAKAEQIEKTIEPIEETLVEEKTIEPIEEDVIIYTTEMKAVIAEKEVKIKPLGDLSHIQDNDTVWVNRGNYQATCLKSWAVSRGYEIIGLA